MKRNLARILSAALAALLILTGAFGKCIAEGENWTTKETEYGGLFDQSRVHTIDIEIADWDTFLANADAEEYVECNVTIDGERLENVAIRTKGNTSLSSVKSLGSSKYSFKIEFDKYDKEISYKGLDKLSLNNLIYDATMMKDYLAYTLMAKMEVPSPMCSFAWVTVNGEDWSLYLAVEAVEDSFLERYGMTEGELYKPDSMSMDRGDTVDRERPEDEDGEGDSNGASGGNAASSGEQAPQDGDAQAEGETAAPEGAPAAENGDEGFGASDGDAASAGEQAPQDGNAQTEGETAAPEDAPAAENGDEGFGASDGDTASSGGGASEGDGGDNGDGPSAGGGGMFGMGGSDVKLQYIDDDPESYPNIFDNAKTKVGKKGKNRLISALKTLSGENAADAAYTDEVTRYLVVHDFLQNGDSYTGSIVHNYYLYEEDGKLAILPWDYNLAFGGMTGDMNGTSTINSPIDSPVDGSVTDRPLIAWIFADDEALQKYHELYDQFVTEIIESGWLKNEITRVAAMILPYLEKDPNSFFSVDEFDVGVQTMRTYAELRGESIRGQLNGTIPSTSEGQNADKSNLVDAAGIDLGLMGAMNRGGNQGGGENGGDGGSSGGQQDSSGEGQGENAEAPAEQPDN